MSPRTARLTAIIALPGLPLAAGWIAGLPAGFAELPPHAVYVHTPAFSAPVYIFFLLLIAGAVAAFAAPRCFGFDGKGVSDFSDFGWALAPRPGHRFPARGWIGITLITLAWPAAWTHPAWLGPAADHTFVPLWLGYVLTVDGLAYRRAGASPITRFGAAWLAWFPVSAVAWWYFELLNRFVQNWVYLGVGDFSPLRYVLGSTFAFSTVIPAVLTTAALLSTFRYFRRAFLRTRTRAWRPRPGLWLWTAAAGAAGLTLIPWFPMILFPLVWIAPMLVLVGLLEHAGVSTGAGQLLRGDWGPVVTLAAAALICGFFWEFWNFDAMPKWIYRIPWVQRFQLFEMPLVGYSGYLPFGLTCWVFGLLLGPGARGSPDRSSPRTGPDRGIGRRRGYNHLHDSD